MTVKIKDIFINNTYMDQEFYLVRDLLKILSKER